MTHPRMASQIVPLLADRWSPRSFIEGKGVSDGTINLLFEAARMAPSSFNEQPWEYLVATFESEGFAKMVDCLSPNNRQWAHKVSLLILSLTRLTFRHNGKVNRHAYHDVGAANFSLVLQAVNEGLYCHQMAGFDMDQTIRTFDLDVDLEPVCFIAVGYKEAADQLPEPLRAREVAQKTRKSKSEFVKLLG